MSDEDYDREIREDEALERAEGEAHEIRTALEGLATWHEGGDVEEAEVAVREVVQRFDIDASDKDISRWARMIIRGERIEVDVNYG